MDRLGAVEVEPFAGLAFADFHADAFKETGGAAALKGASEDFSSTASTVGVRATVSFRLANGMEMALRGTAAWQHVFGDSEPGAALAFAGQADPFVVLGAALAEDSLLAGADLDAALGENAHVGIAYLGQIAEAVHQSAITGRLDVLF